MVQEVVQFARQAPFIEDRVEKLLASVFGIPQVGQPPLSLLSKLQDYLHNNKQLFKEHKLVLEHINLS